MKNLAIESLSFCAVILCDTNSLHKDSPEGIVNSNVKISVYIGKRNHLIDIFIGGLLPRAEGYSVNR